MKQFTGNILITVTVEADTEEDALQLLNDWAITYVDGDDYVNTDITAPIILKEIYHGEKEDTTKDPRETRDREKDFHSRS